MKRTAKRTAKRTNKPNNPSISRINSRKHSSAGKETSHQSLFPHFNSIAFLFLLASIFSSQTPSQIQWNKTIIIRKNIFRNFTLFNLYEIMLLSIFLSSSCSSKTYKINTRWDRISDPGCRILQSLSIFSFMFQSGHAPNSHLFIYLSPPLLHYVLISGYINTLWYQIPDCTYRHFFGLRFHIPEVYCMPCELFIAFIFRKCTPCELLCELKFSIFQKFRLTA